MSQPAEGPVRVRIIVEAKPHEEDVEFDRTEWAAMTPGQRQNALDDAMDTALANAGGAGYVFLTPDSETD